MAASYVDWIPSVKDMIPNSNELTILELGIGVGTKFLLDNFKYVYSFECAFDRDWFDKCAMDYGTEYTKKWKPIFKSLNHFDLVDITNAIAKRDFSTREAKGLHALFSELENLINLDSVDVVFVDPGFYHRAELAEYFMNRRTPIVYVHDYIPRVRQLYGYDKMNLYPDIYNQKIVENGCWTSYFFLRT
jgi:hypothetical protein